jgi:hypothetical protein
MSDSDPDIEELTKTMAPDDPPLGTDEARPEYDCQQIRTEFPKVFRVEFEQNVEANIEMKMLGKQREHIGTVDLGPDLPADTTGLMQAMSSHFGAKVDEGAMDEAAKALDSFGD